MPSAPVRGGPSGTTGAGAGRQGAAHLLELSPGRHLLGEQRGLNAVEQSLQPADQLSLGDPQLGVGGRRLVGERQRDPLELVHQFRREPVLQLRDRGLVDGLQPLPAGLVQRSRLHLVQQLPDHVADPHHLCRLLDHVGHRLGRLAGSS